MSTYPVNRARFLKIVYDASTREHERVNIGTYKEKKLHKILKQYWTEENAAQEVPVAGFIADVQRDDGIIEIQTSGFASMREKLEAFLPLGPVTIVYPVAQTKWISWIDPENGAIAPRNRSPKKGRPFDAIPEMIYIRPYLIHPNLTIRVMLLEIDEYRLQDGRRSVSRKRGSHRYERMPLDLYEIYDFHDAADYAAVIPPELNEPFTAKELMKALKYRGHKQSAVTAVLQETGAIVRDGTRGRAFLYRRGNNQKEI